MHRRAFLAAASTGAISLAGCLTLGSETDTLQLDGIVVVNALNSSKKLSVHVQREGETVYRKQLSLTDAQCDRAIIKPTWEETSANFSVSVRLDGNSTWKQAPLYRYSNGNGCVVLKIELLHPNSGVDISFKGKDCNKFPSPPC